MNTSNLNEMFADYLTLPEDMTGAHWYRGHGGMHYSANGENCDPNTWDGGGYSAERVREYVERSGYAFVRMEDMGESWEAYFSLDMQINPEDY